MYWILTWFLLGMLGFSLYGIGAELYNGMIDELFENADILKIETTLYRMVYLTIFGPISLLLSIMFLLSQIPYRVHRNSPGFREEVQEQIINKLKEGD